MDLSFTLPQDGDFPSSAVFSIQTSEFLTVFLNLHGNKIHGKKWSIQQFFFEKEEKTPRRRGGC